MPATIEIHMVSLVTARNPKNATSTTSTHGKGGCSMAPTYVAGRTPATTGSVGSLADWRP